MTARRTGHLRFMTVEEYLEGAPGGYQSCTLTTTNSGRCVYLPVFPTKAGVTEEKFLLANVPGKC
jgi:hypothetical protein